MGLLHLLKTFPLALQKYPHCVGHPYEVHWTMMVGHQMSCLHIHVIVHEYAQRP
jgi:hypothetical protein